MKKSNSSFLARLMRPQAFHVTSVKNLSRRAVRTLPEIAFRGSAAAMALFALCGFNPQSLAATITKSNTAGDLSTGGVWVGGTAPGSGDIALFNSTITAPQADTLTSAAMTIGEIQLTNPGGAITITPGASQALTLNGVGGVGIDLSSATQNLTIAGPLTLGASQTWNVDNGHGIYINGVTGGGANGITINGVGTVQFSAASNTFTGTITLNGGSLNEIYGTTGNVLSNSVPLAVGGGTVYFDANLSNNQSTQGLGGVTVDTGATQFTQARTSGAKMVTTLGNLSRASGSAGVGGTVIIYPTSNGSYFSSTATNNANGIIGGWAIYNGTDFAKANGAGTAIGVPTYTANTWATNDNTTVAATTESFSGNTGSLLYYLTSSDTVTLSSGAHIISSGGILISNAVTASYADVLTGGTIEGAAGSDLVVNQWGAGTFAINSIIADDSTATALTKAGTGTLLIGGVNTFTGGIYMNAGTLEMSSGGTLNSQAVNFTNNSSAVLDLNGINTSTGLVTTTANLAATAPIIQNANATSSTLTINTAGTGTYAGTVQNGTGAGTLGVTLTGGGTQTLAGSNTYTGATTVTNGNLIFTTSIPSSNLFSVAGGSTLNTSAAGTLTLGTGKTLSTGAAAAATATVTGAVSLSGGTITTGAASSTLQITSLTLGTTGSINYSITDPTLTTGASGLINVSSSGGLTINGGTIYLSGGSFLVGSVYNITYDLFQYTGSIGGTGTGALSVAPASEVNGLTYTIGTSGGYVTLNVSGDPLFLANWTDDASSGSWATAGNWDAGVPNGQSVTAKFGGAASTHVNLARTVTLDGNKTVGVLSFASPNGESYTISQGTGGSLTIDNGTNSGTIAVSGIHTIGSSVAVNLNSNTAIGTSLSSDKLTIGGVISNGSGLGANSLSYATLSTSGPGTLVLGSANTYGPSAGTVGTTIGGGTVVFQNAGAFGSGDIKFGATSTLQAGAAGMSLANNIVIGNGFTATIDTNGNTLTLPGVISDTNLNGSVVVASTTAGGTLILTNAETYGGTTTINSGVTVNVGNGGTTGSLPSTAIVDNGALQDTRSDTGTVTIASAISGSGSLTLNGSSGTIYKLSGASSFSGGTTLTTGEIQLGNNGGLGTGDLTAGANTLDINGYSPTFGALNGSGTVTSSAAGTPTITIGDNNHNSTFSGTIQNGSATSVSLVTEGTGTASLSGLSTYTGTTTVNGGGALTLTGTIGSSGTPSGAFTDNESTVNLTNAALYTSSFTTNNTGANGYAYLNGATLNLGSGALSVGASNGSNGNLLSIVNSTVTAGSVSIGRDGANDGTTIQTIGSTGDGIYMNGGTFTIGTTLGIGISSGATSTAQMRLDAGTVTVGGITTITTNNFRLSLLNINGGSFTDNDPSGTGILVGGVYGGPYAELLVSGGVLTTPEITLGNSAQTSDTDEFYALGGTTYLGNAAGTGGIFAGGATGTTTIAVALGLATATTAPTIGAAGNWSSSLGMTLINSTSAGAVTFKAADAGGISHNISLSGILAGSGGLTKTGGGTLTLTASNSYSGVTAINGGTLNINGEYALGGSAYGGASFNGGTLQYATAFTGNGTGDITQNSTGTAKAVTINSGGATIDTNGNNVTYASPLGGGGTGGLTVADSAGTGSLTLTGSASYTGATTINSGATLQLGAGSTTGRLNPASSVTDGGTFIINRSNAVAQGTDFGSGAISGAGALKQAGSGTTTLTAANTYTGATNVNAGTLKLASGASLGDTAISVASGATLQLNGNTIGNLGTTLTLNGGSTLNIADSALDTVTLVGNGGTSITIGGASAAATLDFGVGASGANELSITNSGLVAFGADGGVIDLVAEGLTAPTSGSVINLISATGGLSISNFSVGNASDIVTIAGKDYTITLGGNSTLLTATLNAISTDYYFTGATNSSWATLGNFAIDNAASGPQTTPINSGANVYLTANSATAGNYANETLDGNYSINSLNFTGTGTAGAGTAITLASSTGSTTYTLTLVAGGSFADGNGTVYPLGTGLVVQSGAGADTISANLALGASQTWEINNSASNPLTVSGVIADGSTLDSLTINGGGKLVLSNNNTYDGGTTVIGATLQLGVTNALATTGALTVGAGGTVDLAGNSQTISSLSDNSSNTGVITASTGSSTLTINNTSANSYSGTITGGISLVLNGSSTVTLSGANSFTGSTTLGGGTLIASTNSALGSSSNGGLLIDPSSGTATVDFTSATPAIGSLASSGAGVSDVVLGNSSGSGSATTLTIGGGGATTTFNGVISDLTATKATAIGNVTVTGGSLTLGGADTYTGLTTVSAGALVLANANAVQNSVLNLTGGSTTVSTPTALNAIGLEGTQNFSLTNGSAAGVALTLTGTNSSANYVYTGNLSGAGSLTKSGGATTEQIGNGSTGGASYTGPTIINTGTLIIGGTSYLTGSVDLNGGPWAGSSNTGIANALTVQDTAVINSTAELYIANSTAPNNSGYAGSGTLTVQGSASVTVAGISFGNGSRVGSGNAINVTGGTLTDNGSLNLYSSEGSTVGNTTVTLSGGTFGVQNFIRTGNGGGASYTHLEFSGGTLEALANDPTSSTFLPALGATTAYLNNGGGAVINTNGYDITIAQALVHGSGTTDGGVTVEGSGTLNLTGANSFNGGATIDSGATLNINGINALGGTVYGGLAFNGGTLQYATTLGSNGSSDITQNAAGTPVAQNVTVNSGGATIDTNGNSVTYAHTFGNGGAGGLTKVGAGTLKLTGAATYNGNTTVNAGTLIVAGGISGTGTVATVGSAGTLEVDSTIANASVAVSGVLEGTGSVAGITTSGGTVEPGLSSALTPAAGTLTSNGNVTLDSTATFSIRLGVVSETDGDQLTLSSGAIALNSANLVVNTGSSLNDPTLADVGDLYTIINGGYNTGTSGFFAGLGASGDSFTTSGGYTFDVFYGVSNTDTTISGNSVDIQLVSIPEPGTWASLLGGFGMLLVWQRSRRRRA